MNTVDIKKDVYFSIPEEYKDELLVLLNYNKIPVDTILDGKLEVSYESKMNNNKLDFNTIDKLDLKLFRILKVFEYHNKKKHYYSIKECSEATGVSVYFTEQILIKHLNYKKLK